MILFKILEKKDFSRKLFCLLFIFLLFIIIVVVIVIFVFIIFFFCLQGTDFLIFLFLKVVLLILFVFIIIIFLVLIIIIFVIVIFKFIVLFLSCNFSSLFNSVYGGGRGSGNKKPKQKKFERSHYWIGSVLCYKLSNKGDSVYCVPM